VRPDWIDNQSILGFINPITGKYESTQALDIILRASKAYEESPDKSDAPRFFMLLDEMNLARVEHYFSDWLACSESRRIGYDKKITQQPITLHRHESAISLQFESDNSVHEVEIPSSINIPVNLIVTGTVNVDESTFGFSPKVLDRSMVIEFNEVDLDGMRSGDHNITLNGYRFPTRIPPYEIPSSDIFRQLPKETHQLLVSINNILEKAQLHFGYRSANEISLFVANYNKILPEDKSDTNMHRALDGAILQKVLPRIHGNRAKIEETLCELLYFLRDLSETPPGDGGPVLSKNDIARLPKSYLRGFEMLERLRSFGFVTFFK
jgi:5-methylcytosine-specific restriction endonuclease McrBC GTP-binding regulatory subunit McrB